MMNDEMKQFEERLRRQPVKQIPGEWRAEILSAAKAAGARKEVSRELTFTATGDTWFARISRLIWPHPVAWAGLAAVWVLVFALNFSMQEKSPAMMAKTQPPSCEVMVELRQQHQMLAELIGSADLRVADRQPLLAPKPRSERAGILVG